MRAGRTHQTAEHFTRVAEPHKEGESSGEEMPLLFPSVLLLRGRSIHGRLILGVKYQVVLRLTAGTDWKKPVLWFVVCVKQWYTSLQWSGALE